MVQIGRIEILATDFAVGWATYEGDQPATLCARLDGKIIGFAQADLRRNDVDAALNGRTDGAGFIILYRKTIDADRVADVEIAPVESGTPLLRAATLKIDRRPRLQIFILGSPRSGTSELGNTVARELKLPWLGEGHAAPLFAAAADSLTGRETNANGLIRFMAKQNYRNVAIEAARRAYYYVHASGSFIDKTPGVAMIAAAPFLKECFGTAKFVYLRRNGISNVLSRMQKFGGNFDAHCADWAAALTRWEAVKPQLPHCLELEQEQMQHQPGEVARRLAEYLETPESAAGFEASLRSGKMEHTGAGLGRTKLDQTGWTPPQMATFRKLCGPTMERYGYEF